MVKNDLQKERTNSQTALETELKKVHHHLELNQRLLEDLAVEHSEWDQEVKAVKSHAVHSANLDWEMGLRQPSNNTLQIDADLSQAQQNCQTIKKRIQEVSQEIQLLHAKQDYLCNEIRPSPTGVAGAEQVPSHGKPITTWHETDIDSGKNFDIMPQFLSQFRLSSVSGLSQLFFRHVIDISQFCLSSISVLSQLFFRPVIDISQLCLSSFSDLS